ncbi:MAG TPA: DUF3040 domain-containing protein [Mycobacteriales bacterium]|nr:putative rane protein [Cryptosporangiaceae bacterium]MDQ1675527.1 hypothetical protein [Actinomycetota bacterium]HEV7756692.1 DUF3040 domain-containing protein [Mycobacteriales bacterium]
MPLSEHEQRLLEQIERALLAEDPKFASTVRSTDPRHHVRRRVIVAGLVFVAGAGLMIAGVVGIKGANVAGIPLVGVAGFLVMFAAVLFGVTAYRRGSGVEPLRVVGGTRSGRTRARRGTFADRLEDRWRRRADDGH